MIKLNATAREVLLNGSSLSPEERAAKEANFYTRIRVQNGLLKMTETRRLDDVNKILVPFIRSRWADETLQVLDVGVSSGVTTMELAAALRASSRPFKIVGTDLCIEASLLSYGQHLHVLCDRKGQALQFELMGFPISNYLGTSFSSWSRRLVPVIFARVLFGLLALSIVHSLIGRPSTRPVRLLTGSGREDPDVQFIEENLFDIDVHGWQYHLIRAANILNPRIFSTPQLHQAIHLLRSRLKTGGLLLIVRSHDDGSNHGACYELQSDHTFRPVISFGSGCEVDSVVRSAVS